MVQWLGLCAFTVKAPGSIPGWGAKSLQALWRSQKKTRQNIQGSRGVHRFAKNWTRLSDLACTHTHTPCWMDLGRCSLMNMLQSTIIPWTPRFSQELAQDPDLCFCGAYTWSDPLPDSFQMGRLLSPHLFFHRRGANGLRGMKSPLKVIAKHWKQSPCSRTDTD